MNPLMYSITELCGVTLFCIYTDERECFAADDFRCNTTGACIRKVQVCDGVLHCTDGSDEMNCCNKFL